MKVFFNQISSLCLYFFILANNIQISQLSVRLERHFFPTKVVELFYWLL